MKKNIREIISVVFFAALIPTLLIVNALQARRYENLLNEVEALEKKQERLVEENKKLIADISLLSNTERIKKIAEEELGMHKAKSDEIVRVEMKDK